jgi:CBS domain-containing protein
MLVHDHMTAHPITLRPDTDFKSALQLMQQHSIHHLPVLDTGNRLVGIVAERDLMFAALRFLGSPVDVDKVMHRDVVTVAHDMSVADAASLMMSHSIGGLPVVDACGNVIGVITESDVFRTFVRMYGEAASGRVAEVG